jgi:hypothetical protein
MRTEVRVHQDAELRLRDEERGDDSPQLRPHLHGEDIGSVVDELAQAEDTGVSQRRHNHSCRRDGPTSDLSAQICKRQAGDCLT